MLELKNIKKDYPAGSGTVHALKGVSLKFRESEFVSILGPSGCGKTTMLNIIGGLDQYTEGKLIINGRSTSNYTDRDWDTYRNYSVGFVFQSYNLIPHQNVLQNVELALTLSGVSKEERRKRAVKALEDVGLGDQLDKKPSEMSGGQMQRVAIARAIVNNPDIILADEPTGALDTVTSVQVMDLLKEIAKDRLVIMVTHNPELAEKYSTRIIRMLDGNITGDTNPITKEEFGREFMKEEQKNYQSESLKKPSMSMKTSFGLSLKNLMSKRGRTILTAFAGSIGIIGIALIFAVSQGMTSYIDSVQEDTLSSYPLMLEEQHMDMGSMLESFMDKATSDREHERDGVYQKSMVYDMVNSLNNMETEENDLQAFKEYIETECADADSASGLHDAVTGVQYTYNTNLLVYTENVDGTIIQSDSQALMEELMIEYFGMDMSSMFDIGEDYRSDSQMQMMSSMSPSGTSAILWQEILPGDDGKLINPVVEKQYDVIYGSWPDAYDEIVLVVDENNEIDDMTLYALGLKSKEDIDALAQAAFDKTEVEVTDDCWTYEQICDMDFRVVLNADCYTKDEKTGLFTDLRESQAGMKYLYDNGMNLKVSGIVRPAEESMSSMLSGTIGYTSALTEYMIEHADGTAAVQAQLEDSSKDIFTGLPFRENTGNLTDSEKEKEFRSYVKKLDEKQKAETYIKMMSIPSDDAVEASVEQTMKNMNRSDMEDTMVQGMAGQMAVSEEEVRGYLDDMSDEDLEELFRQMVEEQVKAQYAARVEAQMAAMGTMQLSSALDASMSDFEAEDFVKYYDEVLTFSDSSYEKNLETLGYVDLDSPSSISLYAATFEDKETIEDAIAAYNESVDDLQEIRYTDYVGLMMSSVTTIINAITYVLIAFVAISLIVSSIMIGVITLISVQERTKEIGILRAIGASKQNVSSMFNAETVIIGFTSGVLGVAVTYLLCIPINAVLHNLTGIQNLNAFLPPNVAVILVIISMILTLISGIIPSRSAAKKDPVVALRTE